ncbi:MAG: hypothetical protein E2O39_14255 [Planctomycetota bacterium]|nr:MAG: hypothetical protein E2O39_14255 [Planctomycetota bacterium]
MPQEKLERTFQMTRSQLDYLERMRAAHSLPDVSKALRVLVGYAMSKPEEENAIFATIRCASPDVCEPGKAAAREEEERGA